jgi:hypothetical protein
MKHVANDLRSHHDECNGHQSTMPSQIEREKFFPVIIAMLSKSLFRRTRERSGYSFDIQSLIGYF